MTDEFYKRNWTTIPRGCFVSKAKDFAETGLTLRYKGEEKKFMTERYNFIEGDLIKKPDIIYKNSVDLEKFKGKKILVLGAGPTTNWYDWDASEYDFIFSCNHFFLNKKIQEHKVDFTFLGSEVDIEREDFIDYVSKNNTIIGLEDYQQDMSGEKIKRLKSKGTNDFFVFVTRFQGKIGIGPKLLVLAILLGAKEVHFAGVDGWNKNYKKGEPDQHSFEKNKKITTSYSYDMIFSHYTCLKKYIQTEIGTNTIVKNLGEGHEQNIWSKIKDFK